MSDIVCKACGARLPGGACHCGDCGFRLEPLVPRPLTEPERAQLADDELLAHAETAVGRRPTAGEAAGSLPEERSPRRHRRFVLRVVVSYGREPNFNTGATENISSGGLFVSTETPLEVGVRVEARFTLPGLEQPFSVPCVVRWVRPLGAGGPGLAGMGLAFEELERELEQTIDSFLVHREPVLYED